MYLSVMIIVFCCKKPISHCLTKEWRNISNHLKILQEKTALFCTHFTAVTLPTPPAPMITILDIFVWVFLKVKKGTEVSKTSRGFDYKYEIQEKAGRSASSERETDGTYEASLTFSIVRPEAARRLDELIKQNPDLPQILPGLENLVEKSRVSPFFKNLYDIHRMTWEELLTLDIRERNGHPA